MLTREQLHTECRKIFDALPDRGETIDGVDDAVLKLNKQAAMAIELQARIDKAIEILNYPELSHYGNVLWYKTADLAITVLREKSE